MSCCDEVFTLEITRGKTTRQSFGYASDELVFKVISAATQAAPCVLTVAAHGLPSDWLFDIVGAKGMSALNQEQVQAKVIDADHLELTNFNAINLPAYTSGGVISYAKPLDLTGYTARMKIRRSYGDSESVLSLAPTIDIANSAVEMEIDETDSAALPISQGVFDIELVNGPEVEELIRGTVIVMDESTDG